jgi:hypothetical protein
MCPSILWQPSPAPTHPHLQLRQEQCGPRNCQLDQALRLVGREGEGGRGGHQQTQRHHLLVMDREGGGGKAADTGEQQQQQQQQTTSGA